MVNKNRAEVLADYLIENNSTIRKTASVFGLSKSTVHFDISKKLKYINYDLYLLAHKILVKNFNEKHLRGGDATKKKYSTINK